MEKKKIIIILVCVLAVLVGVFAVSAAVNKNKEPSRETDSSYTQENENTEVSSQNSEDNASTAENNISETGENSANGGNTADVENNTQKKNAQNSGSSGSKAENNQSAQNTDKENNNSPQNTTQREAEKTTARETQKQNITVSISITCKNAVDYGADVPQSGYFLKSSNYTVKNGSTVFDVLSKACSENSISLSYSSPSYIKGIGGLYEFDCGGGSGWMYRVNGNIPMTPVNKYILKDSDTIELYYVTSSTDK